VQDRHLLIADLLSPQRLAQRDRTTIAHDFLDALLEVCAPYDPQVCASIASEHRHQAAAVQR
jgi:hypothetical protein